MGVSENSGTPKSSISIRFSIINHPFWGTPIFGNTPIWWRWYLEPGGIKHLNPPRRPSQSSTLSRGLSDAQSPIQSNLIASCDDPTRTGAPQCLQYQVLYYTFPLKTAPDHVSTYQSWQFLVSMAKSMWPSLSANGNAKHHLWLCAHFCVPVDSWVCHWYILILCLL